MILRGRFVLSTNSKNIAGKLHGEVEIVILKTLYFYYSKGAKHRIEIRVVSCGTNRIPSGEHPAINSNAS
ncbi:hypothetical protein RhiXN_00147 [Rhizoctonia solani]|uniref:Uncharacterized protein n=1 Tax=Rhizoctonia solani TaxID=456999 RepID=A0A8H8NUM7_9AGAM|nr:uncharacterized protein RhiXN_00147 [Rhizoctonia solani]QRW18741.1 hypothetical protein RhiXN_00147 [Rhizoctonia solani]